MQHCLIIAILFMLCCKSGKTLERDVFEHIFQNYEKRMKPVKNESHVIHVQVQMNIICLLEVVNYGPLWQSSL